jgi:hypothetical protein
VVVSRKVLTLQRPPPGSAGVPSGASMESTEEDVVPMNPGLQTVAKGPSREDAPVEEVQPSVMHVEEGSGAGAPDSFPKVET